MNKNYLLAAVLFSLFLSCHPNVTPVLNTSPQGESVFNFINSHTEEKQFFTLKSILREFEADGKLKNTNTFLLYLSYDPAKNKQHPATYNCMKFLFIDEDSIVHEIPALRQWKYTFNEQDSTLVFGIDHQPFENLYDDQNKPIPFDKSYHIYNTFIDFHALCNVFSEPVSDGKGIQNLKRLNQTIVHASAHSEPTTRLGSNISEGSFYRNGRITLTLKGTGRVNNKDCALIGFDSGQGSFKMIMQPAPDLNIVSTGSSHYRGDIYKDLRSGWVQRVYFNETVISQTLLPFPPYKVHSVIEREIKISNIEAQQFAKTL